MQSYVATVAKFKRIDATMDAAAQEIKKDLDDDLHGFVSGASPSGQARIKWLRQMGHPYARGSSASESTSTGRKRGSGRRGTATTLPIGEISGRLKEAAYVILRRTAGAYTFFAGFNRRAGGSIYTVLPAGTRKMVGRGLWAKGEKGALGQRVKLYRKAFRDYFLKGNQQP